MSTGQRWTILAALVVLVALSAAACGPRVQQRRPAGDALPPPEATPPAQSLVVPGERVEGRLEEGEIDRWVFASAAGRLVTVEVWFRPSTASGPEAEVVAALLGPDGSTVTQERGTVTLPPYIVEQELPLTGSYLLRLEAPSGAAGQYTLLVSLSEERYLTRPDVYTGTLALGSGSNEGAGSSPSWGFLWPSPRHAISGWYFHDAENSRHNGLDIAAHLHDPIYAAARGTVVFADVSGGYGNLVILEHADGWESWYAHLSIISVTVGQEVDQGEIIGAAGSTGYSTGAHLHFELRHQGVPVDPLLYLH